MGAAPPFSGPGMDPQCCSLFAIFLGLLRHVFFCRSIFSSKSVFWFLPQRWQMIYGLVGLYRAGGAIKLYLGASLECQSDPSPYL